MTQSVDDLRNEIRQAVGRNERIESTAFTKEALAAICAAVDYDIDPNDLPSKSQMRAGILWKIDVLNDDFPEGTDRPLRKAELATLATVLRNGE